MTAADDSIVTFDFTFGCIVVFFWHGCVVAASKTSTLSVQGK